MCLKTSPPRGTIHSTFSVTDSLSLLFASQAGMPFPWGTGSMLDMDEVALGGWEELDKSQSRLETFSFRDKVL